MFELSDEHLEIRCNEGMQVNLYLMVKAQNAVIIFVLSLESASI